MQKIYRNIIKGYGIGRLLEIVPHMAKKYNETWYILGNSGMAANDKGRNGWTQYNAMAYNPETEEWFGVEATFGK